MYEQTTKAVTVRVRPEYLKDRSDPDDRRYVWAYHVEIENRGNSTVKLLTRHWRITDGHGRTQEVRGDGVVGEQPVLRPGERFAYTSGCPLTTPSGFMVGSYQMVTPDGDQLEVAIPAFSLDSPHVARSVH
jgi:ApaG protein